MFEREIKFIYDFNLNKVNRLGPYFTFEQLLASDIHPAILQYISAEIDYLIYEDRQKLLKNSLFDYSGEKISFHFNQISEEAKKSKRFAQEYVAKLILHAASFTVNYLVRPKWTLTKFVFDEATHKSTNDIKQILNYVYYYKYVNKILISYINSKKILSMNAQEFEDLMNKADKLGVESYLPAILANALKSMAEFFNIGEIQKNKIPVSAVEMFLEEKELTKHLIKISETFGNEEGAKYNVSDYQRVFSNIVVEKEEIIAEPELQEDVVTEEAVEEIPEPVINEEEPTDEREDIPDVTDEQSPDAAPESDEENEPFYEPAPEDGDEPGNEPIEENNFEDEIEEISDNEVTITPPLKFRININENNRIEPVIEKSKEKHDEPVENEDGTATDDEADVIEIEGLNSGAPEEEPEEEIIEPAGEMNFEDEFNIAEKEFEDDAATEENGEDDEDDQSFLQSLRDQRNAPLLTVENDEDQSTPAGEEEPEEESRIDSDESEENFYDEGEIKREDEAEKVIFTEDKKDDEGLFQSNLELKSEQPKMELAEILENKEMTKIIEVIFDYDIEDFANTLDEISNCKNEDDAHLVINNTLLSRHINRSSKEAEAFRLIISEYFNNK